MMNENIYAKKMMHKPLCFSAVSTFPLPPHHLPISLHTNLSENMNPRGSSFVKGLASHRNSQTNFHFSW